MKTTMGGCSNEVSSVFTFEFVQAVKAIHANMQSVICQLNLSIRLTLFLYAATISFKECWRSDRALGDTFMTL